MPRLLLPVHMVHETAMSTATIITWLGLGVGLTALGGWTASRATTAGRVSMGIMLTVAGVIVLAVGVWYHKSMRP